MANHNMLVAVCIAAVALSSSQQLASKIIYLPDEKQPDMRYQLKASEVAQYGGIGRIECESSGRRSAGTAFVAGDRSTVITVAHYNTGVLPDGTSYIHGEGACTFNLYNVDGSQRIFATQFTRFASSEWDLVSNPEFTEDWSILKLAAPVPREVQPMTLALADTALTGTRKEAVGYRTHLVGFNVDKKVKTRPTISLHCQPKYRWLKHQQNDDATGEGYAISHTCDTGPGSSGSPLILIVNDKLFALAINTADGTGNYNVAIPFPASFEREWRHGITPLRDVIANDAEIASP